MRSLSAKVFRKVFVRDIVLVQQRAGAGDAAGGGKATTSTTSTAGRSDDRRGDEVGKLAKRSRADTAGDRGVAAVGLPFMQRNSRVEITGVVVELEHKPRATFFSVEQQTERASSTGVASAARAYTLNLAAAEGRDEILRSIRARAKIGSVVRVQGVASVYRGSLQLRVESLQNFIDPNAEAMSWMETIELGRDVYGFVSA